MELSRTKQDSTAVFSLDISSYIIYSYNMASEFEIIKRLRSMCPKIGDDAVVLITKSTRAQEHKSKGNTLIASVDAFVEKEHFDLTYFSAYDIGYKSLAASISDIAACGGKPKYALISLGLKSGDIEFVEQFYSGIEDVAKTYGVEIVGGDTTKSGVIFVSVTLLGESKRFISRNGAKVGDVICVTGELGTSFVGLLCLQNVSRLGSLSHDRLVRSHLNPTPRVKEGVKIANYANSMIDISDGLIIDLSHILEESKVCAQIWRSKLPINKETIRIAHKFSVSPYDFAMNGGEDFELLFTVPKHKLKEAKQKVDFTEIGEIINTQNAKRKTQIIDEEGKEIPIVGFDHFRKQKNKFKRI